MKKPDSIWDFDELVCSSGNDDLCMIYRYVLSKHTRWLVSFAIMCFLLGVCCTLIMYKYILKI